MDVFSRFEDKYRRQLNILFWLVLLIGAGLRCYQYLMGRSLWEDEAHMALNMMSRNYAQLLQPLDYVQAAPIGFLLTTKTFTVLFGYSACALRALPFVAAVITLPLFYFILLAFTKSRVVSLLGFFAFSVNIAIIYFSSELKTYEMDVAVYLAIIYLLVSPANFFRKNLALWLGIVGCAGLLYANLTFIFLFCAAVYFLVGWIQKKKLAVVECRVLMAWAIVFLVNYFLFIYRHQHAAAFQEGYAFAFPPSPFSGAAFYTFVGNSIHEICFSLLLYASPEFGFGYLLAGLIFLAIGISIYRKQYTLLCFTCLPILIHFGFAVLKVYPFWYRFLLYFVPVLLLLTCYGLAVLIRLLANVRLVIGLLMVPAIGYCLTKESFNQFPLWFREIRPSLDYMHKNHPSAYVYITTPYTLYKYYADRGYVKNTFYSGIKWNLQPAAYYREVAAATDNYLLLHATDPTVDGYAQVMEDLKQRGLIVKEFAYKSYTVSEVRPVPKADSIPDTKEINYTYFATDNTFDIDGEKVAAIWSGSIVARPFFLAKGSYQMTVFAKGTSVAGVFPHLQIMVNQNMTGLMDALQHNGSKTFRYEQEADGYLTIRIIMDNDATDKARNEDRNAFIQRITFRRVEK